MCRRSGGAAAQVAAPRVDGVDRLHEARHELLRLEHAGGVAALDSRGWWRRGSPGPGRSGGRWGSRGPWCRRRRRWARRSCRARAASGAGRGRRAPDRPPTGWWSGTPACAQSWMSEGSRSTASAAARAARSAVRDREIPRAPNIAAPMPVKKSRSWRVERNWSVVAQSTRPCTLSGCWRQTRWATIEPIE